MGAGHGIHVVALAAGGRLAMKLPAVPGGHATLAIDLHTSRGHVLLPEHGVRPIRPGMQRLAPGHRVGHALKVGRGVSARAIGRGAARHEAATSHTRHQQQDDRCTLHRRDVSAAVITASIDSRKRTSASRPPIARGPYHELISPSIVRQRCAGRPCSVANSRAS